MAQLVFLQELALFNTGIISGTYYPPRPNWSGLVTALHDLPNVRRLTLSKISNSDVDDRVLEHLFRPADVSFSALIILGANSITDLGVGYIADACGSQLRELSLSQCWCLTA